MTAYHKYQPLLRSLAWRQAKGTGASLDDCLSLANYGYVKALASYDPAKGAFSTHLTWTVKGLFRNQITRKQIETEDIVSVPDMAGGDDPERSAAFRLGVQSIGQESKLVINLILDSPAEIFDWSAEQVITRLNRVREYLYRYGWNRARVTKAFAEIRQMLRSL